MSLIDHAKKELELASFFDPNSDYEGMLGTAVMELIELFSKQDHSGSSANIVSNLFYKLSRYETLSPLTGKDEEWIEISNEMFQNKRNSAVFKDSKDGKAYFIDAFIKKTPNGSCWSGSLNLKDGKSVGKCYIKDFKNIPTIYIY